MKGFRSFTLAACAAVCAFGQTTPVPFSTGQAARLVIGQTNFTADNYGATNTLIGAPSGIAYANGSLWVADANRLGALPDNNRVLQFNDVASFPGPTQDPTIIGSTCGVCRGVANLVLGQPNFISANSGLSPTALRNPTGIATDGNILVVADTDNNRVLIWNSIPTSNGQPPNVVVGQPNFTSNAAPSPPTAQSLRGPIGVWLAGGKLFIADNDNNRVLIYNHVPTANYAAADVVVGQPNFTSYVQPDLTQPQATTAANNLQNPVSVTTDATHMFITDLGQNRVLIYNSIPTTNGASADVVVGQVNMSGNIPNNTYTITNYTVDSYGNPEGISPAMCQPNAAFAASVDSSVVPPVDADGYEIGPPRCAATLSEPRFALSDGTRLFIADAGNDRVMVYNTIPTTNGVSADAILGEPDEFSDNTGTNPAGADAMQSPTALAWDGSNLYVSDTYNNRVVVYTAEPMNIPLAAVRNSASLQIYALASVTVGGTITAKDVLTIGINATCTAGQTGSGCYSYTVQSTDTLTTITDALVKLIDKTPDPNVTAGADDTLNEIVLTARQPGQIGGNVTLMTITNTSATETLTASGTNLNIYLENPTSIAPGTLILIYGTNLCDNTASGDLTKAYVATSLGGCQVFADGVALPLLYVSPTQINAQFPYEFTDRSSSSVYSRVTHADGSITVSAPVGVTVPGENPGIFALGGNDPRPGLVYHAYSNATDAVELNGSITAGDVVSLTIANAPGSTTNNTYSYTVLSTDTLQTVATGLANAINAAPDPNVLAIPGNEFQTIILEARLPGPAGENIAIGQSTTGVSSSTGATETITIINPITCCDNIASAQVTTANPAVPGEIVYVFATGLGPPAPSDQSTGEVYRGGTQNPPATPVDSILTDGSSATILSAFLVPGTIGVYAVEFELLSGLGVDPTTQLTIAQQSYVSNVVTFAVGNQPQNLGNALSGASFRRPSAHAAREPLPHARP